MAAELEIVRVSFEDALRKDIEALYERAFPDKEKVSLEPFFADDKKGAAAWAVLSEGRFCAFFCSLEFKDLFYLFYLAVDSQKRGRGLGSKVLKAVTKLAGPRRVFLDCEGVYPGCANPELRKKRLNFYKRAGFREVGPLNHWRGEYFRSLHYGEKDITQAEIDDFWERFRSFWDEHNENVWDLPQNARP